MANALPRPADHDISPGDRPMSTFAHAVRRFVRDEAGASMAEYALLIAVIALVAVAGAKTLGTSLNDKFSATATKITTP